ncbi:MULTISPECIES: GTPase Era [unclassified Aureispira]|uniref:GTPase Era n=1 Tax=unclassified Aureispira TaxID=2649989 RepID=UPI000697F0F6|nr:MULTISPECIES: GTPase Era [unclassified Aureispira]WMX13008.1 GTPase Era [Aureispira sp. CCB-E]
MKKPHRSGFVNIIGRPNVGKSTLMNALVGERMSIITNKPQTTRHRIIGIVSDEDYQIVFSDTPGFIKDPSYEMQESMNKFVSGSFKDGDIMVLVVDVTETYDNDNPLFKKLQGVEVPLFLVLNKKDLVDEGVLLNKVLEWKDKADFQEIIPISALQNKGTDVLLECILDNLPIGPVYYPKDQFTDRPERFFVSEIIREKILMNYYQEIPYSCEVVVDAFKEDPDPKKNLVRIHATIFVARASQKNIIIGKKGAAIKKVGIDARYAIEKFLEKKIYLELFVKVKDNWRNDDKMLKSFGYKE